MVLYSIRKLYLLSDTGGHNRFRGFSGKTGSRLRGCYPRKDAASHGAYNDTQPDRSSSRYLQPRDCQRNGAKRRNRSYESDRSTERVGIGSCAHGDNHYSRCRRHGRLLRRLRLCTAHRSQRFRLRDKYAPCGDSDSCGTCADSYACGMHTRDKDAVKAEPV